MRALFSRPRSPGKHVNPSFGPATAPAPSPIHQAPVASPSSHVVPRHRHGGHHHHRHVKPQASAPSPSEQGCDQICVEPLTATPFGSPCGCVFPMKVRLLLTVAPYAVFPVMNELEIEVAAGIYLQQSQVKIMGATADTQNQGRTMVEINLVPLGEKFDNTTAILTYDRLWHKRVSLNSTLFGTYEVVSISYPGIPASPPHGNFLGNGPTGSAGDLPITANFLNKNQKMNIRIIAIIVLSAFVLLLVLVGVISALIKWRKVGRPSNAVGPALPSSVNKRSGSNYPEVWISADAIILVSLIRICDHKSFVHIARTFFVSSILYCGCLHCIYHLDEARFAKRQLVDPSLAGTYDFDDMAKVAAIASMCVHPEVAHRPFMGEVVQALKLIYNDTDETGGDCCSQKESSAPESDFKGDFAPSDSSWWNAGGVTPRLTYGQTTSFITMEYSSGPLEEMENRQFSTSSLVGDGTSLPIRHGNRSGPLRTVRSKPSFYRLRGSMSEHGGLLPRQNWSDAYWV
ncbi:hypothetical protein QQP08_000810 [Theobroma cacao]|nr:hypothetical protein QQP08_000810 [Theobroma cacao]